MSLESSKDINTVPTHKSDTPNSDISQNTDTIFAQTKNDTFRKYQLFLNLCLGRVRESRNNLTWHQFLHVFLYLDV